MYFFKNLWEKKEAPVPPNIITTTIVKSLWRNNMWVMSPKGVGILFKMGQPCEVHIVDDQGLTVSTVLLPLEQLRQATFNEIPHPRRGVSEERAKLLGY
jgi:hypothetical protein